MAKPKSLAAPIRFVVGVDEAGRGPLAGPVSVGVVVVPASWYTTYKKGCHPFFADAKDSKLLTPASREKIFKKLQIAKKDSMLDYAVTLVSAKSIDAKGIVPAIRRAMAMSLKKLSVPPHQTRVLLDGSLYAPEEFLYQETIIRGDQSESIISLASIAAKVTRDRHMVRLAKKYPDFGFEIHKGYGTAAHRTHIKKYGLSPAHRRSFLRGILKG